MMLPRERLQVGFAFLSLFLFGFGLALARPGATKDELPAKSQGVGFWKDAGLSLAAGRTIAPWMFGCSAAALVGACLCRSR